MEALCQRDEGRIAVREEVVDRGQRHFGDRRDLGQAHVFIEPIRQYTVGGVQQQFVSLLRALADWFARVGPRSMGKGR
ncbi:hypothetical protein [Variovorax sp. J31P207]|uniref:hypothetical protein n=1 Tax=Variovorax sp. J31P207 TaxID=3053510 RepID=UPI00257501EA|nr:hypothetical protein [Variovorax sp. J31P207]MDM0066878.1 hypothetical protein [Variovorax sp. J31P207]